ncbi:hypothetical protein [Chitinolyticbacter meiyuanensis]|uniref:hypothetical protein n=1 Tax=Chitinolyticbacter meiyuanensis TaxID=682798 RepID=UPI0011E59909|nr:hypothetical protein [Chitinolyticbacter meiyuanensis]
MIFVALNAAAVELIGYSPDDTSGFWRYLNSATNIAIPIWGTWWCFNANGGKQGTQFLAKYLSIGFVAMLHFIMVLVIGIVAIVVLFALLAAIHPAAERGSDAMFTLFGMAWYVALYLYMARHIGDTVMPAAEEAAHA